MTCYNKKRKENKESTFYDSLSLVNASKVYYPTKICGSNRLTKLTGLIQKYSLILQSFPYTPTTNTKTQQGKEYDYSIKINEALLSSPSWLVWHIYQARRPLFCKGQCLQCFQQQKELNMSSVAQQITSKTKDRAFVKFSGPCLPCLHFSRSPMLRPIWWYQFLSYNIFRWWTSLKR